MKYVADGAVMKALDNYTIQNIGIPAMVLMENSALAVADTVMAHIDKQDRILAVCGTGNNGGDGVAAARLLKEKGYHVAVLILGDEKRATDQTKQQLFIAKNLGVPILNNARISEYNVIIDAVFGIGLSKPVGGIFESVINEINSNENKVFSVDMPSGIDAASGRVMQTAVKADYTVTFGLNKKGLILFPGSDYAGTIVLKDIGFPKAAVEAIKPDTFVYGPEDLKRLPVRSKYSNKGNFGKVLIIAGSKNMCGACFLSAKAAYRTGAGLVKVLTVEDNRNIVQTALPEAILSTYNPIDLKNKLEVDRIIQEVAWATTVVIGPGIGITGASDQLLDIVMSRTKVPIVLDADALNILSGRKQYIGKENQEERNDLDLPSHMILTPHLKEMARLLDCSVEEVRADIVNTAVNTVKSKEFILALKDARTVVTDGKKVYINTSGNHGMATGGSGDVLTGIIAALLAQGMERFEAAALGVYIHGLAADYAVSEKSFYSLIASDIIEALPYILR